MKVIIKGAGLMDNVIREFFMSYIFPILKHGIAIEPSNNIITVYEKDGENIITKIDPTAEVVVELSEEAKNLAMNLNTPIDLLKKKSGNFFDEALAIRKIEELKPPFSVEYYSCRYTPPNL